jgi:hypothetical protein
MQGIPVQNRESLLQTACITVPKTIKSNRGLPMAEASGLTRLQIKTISVNAKTIKEPYCVRIIFLLPEMRAF